MAEGKWISWVSHALIGDQNLMTVKRKCQKKLVLVICFKRRLEMKLDAFLLYINFDNLRKTKNKNEENRNIIKNNEP